MKVIENKFLNGAEEEMAVSICGEWKATNLTVKCCPDFGKNSQRGHLMPTLVKAGLCMSVVGDVLLMIDELSAFMIGTGFFLLAHVLYCIAFTIG